MSIFNSVMMLMAKAETFTYKNEIKDAINVCNFSFIFFNENSIFDIFLQVLTEIIEIIQKNGYDNDGLKNFLILALIKRIDMNFYKYKWQGNFCKIFENNSKFKSNLFFQF